LYVAFHRKFEATRDPGAINVITGWNVPKDNVTGIAHSIQFRSLVHMFHLLLLLSLLLSKPFQHLQPALKCRRVTHNSSTDLDPGMGHERRQPVTNDYISLGAVDTQYARDNHRALQTADALPIEGDNATHSFTD
jgi:hypothetical protein